MPRSVSRSTAPSTTMRPLPGRRSPAIALTTEVLPAPAGEMNVELEGAELVLDIDLEHRAHSGSCRASPKTAASRLSRTVSMWSRVKPGLIITKTYNLEACAGVGAPERRMASVGLV